MRLIKGKDGHDSHILQYRSEKPDKRRDTGVFILDAFWCGDFVIFQHKEPSLCYNGRIRQERIAPAVHCKNKKDKQGASNSRRLREAIALALFDTKAQYTGTEILPDNFRNEDNIS